LETDLLVIWGASEVAGRKTHGPGALIKFIYESIGKLLAAMSEYFKIQGTFLEEYEWMRFALSITTLALSIGIVVYSIRKFLKHHRLE